MRPMTRRRSSWTMSACGNRLHPGNNNVPNPRRCWRRVERDRLPTRKRAQADRVLERRGAQTSDSRAAGTGDSVLSSVLALDSWPQR